MSKILKRSIFLIIITLGLLFLLGTSVNATEIDSVNTLKDVFKGKNVTINGSTITLNDDVTINDVIEVMEGEYQLNLNGHTLKVGELYVVKGKLTIDDATKQGKIDARFVQIEQEGTLEANQCTFATDEVDNWDGEIWECVTDIVNCGKLTIKNSNAENAIWNEPGAVMTIENVITNNISQFGTATIKGGKYQTINTDISTAKTEIAGAEFAGWEDDGFAVMIQSPNWVNKHTINAILADGYAAKFETFNLEINEPVDEQKYYTGTYGLGVKIVKASEVYSDTFKKIAPDGIWEVQALAPIGVLESEALLSSIATKIVESEGYRATGYAFCPGDEFSADRALVCLHKEGAEDEEHVVRVKYLEPDKSEKGKIVSSVLDKMKYWGENNEIRVDNAYILEDLYLINYLFANSSSAKVKGPEALNFARDLIEATGGANVSFEYDSRNGGANPNALYTHSSGLAVVCVGEEPVSSRKAGLTASHVLYIPDDTQDTDDAYIAAALKRIKEYMGNDANITITVGGKFVSLNEDGETYNQYNLFDETKTGDNYYIVKINGKSYNFAICKKEANKLETPKYVGKNLGNNITITSDSTEIPLDTAITVKPVTSDKIKETLGTSIYAAYDISLYSNAKQVNISKLENGKFFVSIPIPESLKGKEDITVYYINEAGEKEPHTTTVKDGMVTFETDHFSTYVLAETIQENEKDDTPKTGIDIITYVLLTFVISIILFIAFRKKV